MCPKFRLTFGAVLDRLELRSSVLPRELSAADATNVSVAFALVNWGFSAPISPRPVRLVLLGGNGSIVWQSPSMADPRDWQPHMCAATLFCPPSGQEMRSLTGVYRPGDPTFTPTVHRFGARGLSISASVSRGAKRWGLYLPDMRMGKAVAAGVGAEYCIRLANQGVPWVGGVSMTACKRCVSLGLFFKPMAATQVNVLGDAVLGDQPSGNGHGR